MQNSNKKHNLAVCMIASGSKGNSIFISDGLTSILIDAGLSGIEIERRMKDQNLNPKNLDAVVVSHEHTDHIKSVGVLSRRFNLPVYINRKTHKAASRQLGKIDDIRYFECGFTFMLSTLTLHPFSISHDAEDPAGFTIKNQQGKIGIVTDTGMATAMVKENLKQCSVLILEANHDLSMLINGPYPWPLKQRIKSKAGHLSNEESKTLLQELYSKQLSHVILSHLSDTNNNPTKAISVVGQAIYDPSAIKLSVVTQDKSSDLIFVK